jgi:branched-chain amino acid transport system permease protein
MLALMSRETSPLLPLAALDQAILSKIHQFIDPFITFFEDLISLDPVLLQLLVFGLLVGGVYALVALGLTMIYGVMDIINVAHGMFMGIGMYTVWFAWAETGINPFLLVPLAIVVTFVLGAAVHRTMVEPLIEASPSAQVLVLLGVLFIIQSGLQIQFNPDPRTIDVSLGSAEVGSVFIPYGQLFALGITVLAVAVMWTLLYRTNLGRAIRATADDLDSARYRGINVPRINYLTFGRETG